MARMWGSCVITHTHRKLRDIAADVKQTGALPTLTHSR
jgi:hypothetical protein